MNKAATSQSAFDSPVRAVVWPAALASHLELEAKVHAVRDRQGTLRRQTQPIAVVGPRLASPAQLECAWRLGLLLGLTQVPVLCGGKHGVMASVSQGVYESQGLVIGLLPEEDLAGANPHLSVALPTGLGITRNALIARCSSAMIAIGGGLGTHSEVALALQWGKRVLCIHGAPDLPGRVLFADEAALFEAVMAELAS